MAPKSLLTVSERLIEESNRRLHCEMELASQVAYLITVIDSVGCKLKGEHRKTLRDAAKKGKRDFCELYGRTIKDVFGR